MKRPIWFKAESWGAVPVHWTPITWQGWAVIGAYIAALLGGLRLHNSPTLLIVSECGFVIVMIGVAALTDDRPR